MGGSDPHLNLLGMPVEIPIDPVEAATTSCGVGHAATGCFSGKQDGAAADVDKQAVIETQILPIADLRSYCCTAEIGELWIRYQAVQRDLMKVKRMLQMLLNDALVAPEMGQNNGEIRILPERF